MLPLSQNPADTIPLRGKEAPACPWPGQSAERHGGCCGEGRRKRHFVGSKPAEFNRRITGHGIWWLEIGGLKEGCSVQSPFCQTQGERAAFTITPHTTPLFTVMSDGPEALG